MRTYADTDERQAQIVQAAIQLVGKYGLRGATTARIAKELRLSEAALYRHFGNKTEILRVAFAQLCERVDEWLRCSSAPSVLDRLREIGLAHVEVLSADVDGYTAPMMRFVTMSREESQELWQAVEDRLQERQGFFAALLDEGKAQHSIRQDIDPVAFATQWMSWAQGEDIHYVLMASHGGTFSRESHLRTLELILRDVAADTPHNTIPDPGQPA